MKSIYLSTRSRAASIAQAAGLALALLLFAGPAGSGDAGTGEAGSGEKKELGRELTEADWKALEKGEMLKQVVGEGGTRSGAWSAKIFDRPPEQIWKAIVSLELYDDYVERTTVSVLVGEAVKDKILNGGMADADKIEALFDNMEKGHVKELGGGRWRIYSYQRNELPWPVSDRWVLLEMTHDDEKRLQTWKRLAGNIKEDRGSWEVREVPGEKDKCLAINVIHLDLDIPATGPFTAYAMDKTLPDTYASFEKIAAHLAASED